MWNEYDDDDHESKFFGEWAAGCRLTAANMGRKVTVKWRHNFLLLLPGSCGQPTTDRSVSIDSSALVCSFDRWLAGL